MPFGCGGSLSSRLSESRRLVYGLLCDGVVRWGAPVRHFALLALPVPNVWISIWCRCHLPGKSLFLCRLDSLLRAGKTSFLTDGMGLLPRKWVFLRLLGSIGLVSSQSNWGGTEIQPIYLWLCRWWLSVGMQGPYCRSVGW